MNSYRFLRSYEFAHEAQLDLMQLQDEGIAATLKNERMVNDEDFDTAAKVLAYEADGSALLQEMYPEAPLEPVPTCPNCGSTNLFQGRSAWRGLLFLMITVLPFTTPTQTRHCAACGHRWKTES